MFSASDHWLGIGIAMMIGVVVVAFAICLGKSIIWLFGTGQEVIETFGRDKMTIKSEIDEAA